MSTLYSHYQILHYLCLFFLIYFALVCFFQISCCHDSGSYCPVAMWTGPSWKQLDRTLQGFYSSASVGSTKFDDRHPVTCGHAFYTRCKHQNPSNRWGSRYVSSYVGSCCTMYQRHCVFTCLAGRPQGMKSSGEAEQAEYQEPSHLAKFLRSHDWFLHETWPMVLEVSRGIKVELSAGPPLLLNRVVRKWVTPYGRRDALWCTVPR